MKKCIWCSKTENQQSFDTIAHTFPKSLGGANICVNVCDSCNHYFGSPQPNLPSVEVIFKEIFNISKHFILYNEKKIPKNTWFKSQYFKFDTENYILKVKPSYILKQGFQEKIGRQFKRGVYKIYLEERERILGDAHDEKFNFIREFSRYNLSDYPIYYLKPKFPALFISDNEIKNPILRFTEFSEEWERMFGIYTYPIMGINLCIPCSKFFENFSLERFQNYLIETNNSTGTSLVPINYVSDIDFTFQFLKDDKW